MMPQSLSGLETRAEYKLPYGAHGTGGGCGGC